MNECFSDGEKESWQSRQQSDGGEAGRGNSQVKRGRGSNCMGASGIMKEGRQVRSGEVVDALLVNRRILKSMCNLCRL